MKRSVFSRPVSTSGAFSLVLGTIMSILRGPVLWREMFLIGPLAGPRRQRLPYIEPNAEDLDMLCPLQGGEIQKSLEPRVC